MCRQAGSGTAPEAIWKRLAKSRHLRPGCPGIFIHVFPAGLLTGIVTEVRPRLPQRSNNVTKSYGGSDRTADGLALRIWRLTAGCGRSTKQADTTGAHPRKREVRAWPSRPPSILRQAGISEDRWRHLQCFPATQSTTTASTNMYTSAKALRSSQRRICRRLIFFGCAIVKTSRFRPSVPCNDS